MGLKDYITFTRWHTAALTVPITVIGLLIAGVPAGSWQVLEFALFGLLFHALGFAQNNLADYKYDIEDPSKSSHPLVSGKIKFRAANFFINFGILGLFIFGLFLSRDQPYSIFFLGLSIISGYVYNTCSKDTVWGFIPITLCFSSLPMFAYFAYQSNLSHLMLLVYLYIVLQMIFQIAVEGCLKELMQEKESNLMRTLGYRVEHGILKTSMSGGLFAYMNKVIGGVLGAQIVVSLTGSLLPIIVMGIVAAIGAMMVNDLLLREPWDRQRVVRDSAIIEILSYVFLIVALQGLLGWSLVAIFILVPVTWFIFWNRIFWNTFIMPKV